ncbi:hypothetical protein [Olsenella uli]
MIQIRPSAVQAQIEGKYGVMSALSDECERIGRAAQSFADEEALTGPGWDAAKSRIAAYSKLTAAMVYACGIIGIADRHVFSALSSRFGSTSAVDEEEWLQMQQEARHMLAQTESILSSSTSRGTGQDGALGEYASAIPGYLERIRRAGEVLSKIYSYCEETNGLYSDDELSGLCNLVARGTRALASSGFDGQTCSWSAWDDGWVGELDVVVQGIAACDPMSETGAVDTDEVSRALYMMRAFPEGSAPYESAKRMLEAALGKIMEMDEGVRRAALACFAQSGLVTGARDEYGYLSPQCSDELGTILQETGTSWDVFLADAGYDEHEGADDLDVADTAIGTVVSGLFEAPMEDLGFTTLADGFNAVGGTASLIFIGAEMMHSYQDAYDDAFYLDERSRRIHARSELDFTLCTGSGEVAVGAAAGSVAGFIAGGPVGTAVGALVGIAVSGVTGALGIDEQVHGVLAPILEDYSKWMYDSDKRI